MGRKSGKAGREIVAAGRGEALGPAAQREVGRLTERYHELRRQGFRYGVDTVIELGQIVLDVERWTNGGLRAWCEREGVSRSTAYNQASLARLAEDSPGIIQRWKELGPAKLYGVARLLPPARAKVLVKGSEEKLARSTDAQFAQIIRPHLVRKRKVTQDMRASGLRQRLQAWTRRISETRLSGIEDAALRAAVLGDARELERALASLRKRI